eukprot:1150168-Pyramimonas_sp.AAC.2
MSRMVAHMERLLKKATSEPLSFVALVPKWEDLPYYQKLQVRPLSGCCPPPLLPETAGAAPLWLLSTSPTTRNCRCGPFCGCCPPPLLPETAGAALCISQRPLFTSVIQRWGPRASPLIARCTTNLEDASGILHF